MRRHGRVTASPQDKHKAVIYCRVSSEEQESNHSLANQQKACHVYCQQKGLTIVEEFREVASAKTAADRPEFNRMLAFCQKNRREIGAVVVFKVDRFARNTADHTNTGTILRGLGIHLHSTQEPFDDSAVGKLMESMMASFAQFDNDVRRDRTVAGMKSAQAAGDWTHRAPIGYLNADVPGKLSPDPVRAPLVQKAFQLASEGYTKSEILTKLLALGLTMPDSGKPISAQTLDKLLRNPIYTGLIVSAWGLKGRGKFTPLVPDNVFPPLKTS